MGKVIGLLGKPCFCLIDKRVIAPSFLLQVHGIAAVHDIKKHDLFYARHVRQALLHLVGIAGEVGGNENFFEHSLSSLLSFTPKYINLVMFSDFQLPLCVEVLCHLQETFSQYLSSVVG